MSGPTDRRNASAMLALALLGVRIALLGFGLSTLAPSSAGYGLGNDARRFHDISQAPGTPYRDFPVEIPPVAVGVVEAIDGASSVDLAKRLAVLMLACDVGVALVLLAGWGRRTALVYWVIGTPLAFFLYLRLDLLTVLLSVVAVLLAKRRAQAAGGALFSLAVFTKLWPLVLLPLLWIARARRALAVAVAGVALGGLAWVAWVGVRGPIQVLTFRHAVGWEIESPIGFAVWRISGDVAVRQAGALRVGTVPVAVRALLYAGAATTIGWGWWRSRMRPDLAEGYGATVAVAGLMVFSTLLSHQYVAWLLPWVAISASRRVQLLAAIAAVAASATMLYTATSVPHAFTIQLWMLGLRNAAIVGVLAVAAWELRSATQNRGADLG